ncbi:MAG: DUF4867 family protein [Fusicatenibacter sp.]|nr:DUF4867 family protein [Fusicatenibacter sp.]
MQILKVTDEAFRPYGKVITGIDVSDIITAMEETPCPENVVYEPSISSLEACKSADEIAYSLYGGMPIQIGYCNGNNYLLNAVEYHRDSEVNIAVTDMILILGKEQDITCDHTYDSSKMEAFLVPAGTMIEVYATTLHYAPCNVAASGFKAVVVLPKGTNTEIERGACHTPEDELLFARNKWLLSHPDAKIEGSVAGIKGENLSVR